MVYILVAVGGFFTCGDQCDEIIINRDHRPGTNDYAMDLAKVALLVCLIVGIIIRNQSNKAGIFGIIDQFKKINEHESVRLEVASIAYNKVGSNTQDNKITDSESGKLSDELRKASSEVLNQKIDSTPFWVIIVIQFVNSFIPAATAILVKDDLINYVESGSGFLAPVFLIIYPCRQI